MPPEGSGKSLSSAEVAGFEKMDRGRCCLRRALGIHAAVSARAAGREEPGMVPQSD